MYSTMISTRGSYYEKYTTGWLIPDEKKNSKPAKMNEIFQKVLPIIFAQCFRRNFVAIFCEIPLNFAILLLRNFTKFREINFNFVFREINKTYFRIHPTFMSCHKHCRVGLQRKDSLNETIEWNLGTLSCEMHKLSLQVWRSKLWFILRQN
jgi:hypothetical protein